MQVFERLGEELPRGIRAEGRVPDIGGNAGKLCGVGEWIRADGYWGRLAGGGAGVQPDAVQHEAGHNVVRVPDSSVGHRPEGKFGVRDGALHHPPDRGGHGRAHVGSHVFEGPPGRAHHQPGIERTRPPPSSLLPPPRGPGDPVGLALNLIIIVIIKLAFILLSRNKN